MKKWIIILSVLLPATAFADIHYVRITGSGSACTQTSPCSTITAGIAAMSGGDTLIVGDGTYSGSISGSSIPSGSASAYTTIQAENVHGAVITGSVAIQNNYIKFDGFKVNGNGANPVVMVYGANHVKIMRVAAYGAASTGNTNVFDATSASYILFEDCWAWGTGRYKFSIYWCDHVIVRRCVARHDYHNDSLQCANFNNYDSVYTIWQNNIAIDSSTANCVGGSGHFGGFFFENKSDHADDTTQWMYGNIVLNVTNATYAGGILDRISGSRTINDQIIWGGQAGYVGEQGPGTTATATFSNWTVGALTGTYDGRNGAAADGTSLSIIDNISNSIKNSIFYGNHSYGIADYVTSDYNSFYGNGANAGGSYHTPSVDTHSLTTTNPRSASLLYLPRIESGSPLKTAGQGGAQIGAQILYRHGASGTLWGETGYNTLTPDPLWPFPYEAYIKSDMASYSGPGAAGARGFSTGTSRDGSAQTLTKYIWEYLGNQIPSDIYSEGGSKILAPKGLRVVSP